MKQENVKRIFFEEGYMLPSYEMENGEILHAYSSVRDILYMTDEEARTYTHLKMSRMGKNAKRSHEISK